jgi:uncharacterized protein YhfF
MHNTQSGHLTLVIYRNNQPMLTKQIPAEWFPFVHQIYLNDNLDTSFVKVINQEGQEFILVNDPIEPIIDSQDLNQLSQRIYTAIKLSKDNELASKKLKETLEKQMQQAARLAELEIQQAIEAAAQGEELRKIEFIENQKRSQSEADKAFQEMINQQRQAEANAIRLKAEHDTMIETLHSTLLAKLKDNPLSVVEVLESEIIQFEPVQLAVAEAIDASDEACEVVIKSPEHLWTNNFIIMRSIILKVTYNKRLAQMIGNVFPPDHLLINMLNKVGR